MFDWSGKNGDESGKSQGILISRVSGSPVKILELKLTVDFFHEPHFNHKILLCHFYLVISISYQKEHC